MPDAAVDGVSGNTLNEEFCSSMFTAFDDRDRFNEVGGWSSFNDALSGEWVLVMSLWDDVSETLCITQPTTKKRKKYVSWLTKILAPHSITPICSGSTRATRPRRPDSLAATEATARKTLVSQPTSRANMPM